MRILVHEDILPRRIALRSPHRLKSAGTLLYCGLPLFVCIYEPTNKNNITNNLKPMGRWDITAQNAS